MVDITLLATVKLEADVPMAPFDCGDDDLNAFLRDDARNYYDDLMGVTYLVACRERLAGYYCLFADKIVFDFSGRDDPNRIVIYIN